jgi:predicted nuclease with TOPRIM domain
MRDIKSLLLVLLSTGLICTWIYHLYDKTVYSKRRTEVYIKDSIAVAEGIRDSLQKIYTGTINDLDTKLDSTITRKDSLQSELGEKLDRIKNLKNEINSILGKKGVSDEELNVARGKINELQKVISELRQQNGSMEDEKKRLTLVMEQMNGDISGLQESMKKLSEENKVLSDKINLASIFVASEVHLSAVTVKGSKEEETSQARKAEKFVFSFLVQNNVNQYTGAEVFVVITGPDGQVLQNEGWESKNFDTKNEGTKEYTLKVRFDYEKGEQKLNIFSLNTDKYQKGNYVMRIYHNGYMIGQTVKTLS